MTKQIPNPKQFFGKTATLLLLIVFVLPAFSQGDDTVVGRLLIADTRQPLGKAEILTASNEFGLSLKLWLNGGKVRIIYPHSGARSSTLHCSFREYKYDASDPRNSQLWTETGAGTVALQIPTSKDVVRSMTGTMVMTKKVVGEDEVAVQEIPQKFVIVIE